jgi:hypothetical protein
MRSWAAWLGEIIPPSPDVGFGGRSNTKLEIILDDFLNRLGVF